MKYAFAKRELTSSHENASRIVMFSFPIVSWYRERFARTVFVLVLRIISFVSGVPFSETWTSKLFCFKNEIFSSLASKKFVAILYWIFFVCFLAREFAYSTISFKSQYSRSGSPPKKERIFVSHGWEIWKSRIFFATSISSDHFFSLST